MFSSPLSRSVLHSLSSLSLSLRSLPLTPFSFSPSLSLPLRFLPLSPFSPSLSVLAPSLSVLALSLRSLPLSPSLSQFTSSLYSLPLCLSSLSLSLRSLPLSPPEWQCERERAWANMAPVSRLLLAAHLLSCSALLSGGQRDVKDSLVLDRVLIQLARIWMRDRVSSLGVGLDHYLMV